MIKSFKGTEKWIKMTIKYSTSDSIENLPFKDDILDPTDYNKIAPLLHESSKLVYPLQRYIILFVLFIILSLSSVDTLLLGFFPKLQNFSYLVNVVKALILVVIIYIIDNVQSK